jgi:coenzyme F420-dependent glucose-6-phosphate dehydrogenase
MLQLGWKAGTEQYGPNELVDFAIAAEAAGFDSIDASDHFHPWAEKGQASFVWSVLGAIAARTSRITLGTGVTCPILRYHPAIIAQAAATVAALAPGRFFLGVGTGEALNEYSATGLWPSYNERRAQLAEAIELIRALWTGEKITHKGEHYETHEAKLYTLPDEPIPLYLSSLVPASARFAGEYGDGLITAGGEEPDTYLEMIRSFAAGAKQAGRNAARAPRMIELAVGYTDDENAAIEGRKDYWAGTFVPAMFTEKIYTPELSEKNGKIVGAETIRGAGCFSADPDEHVKHARKYMDLGFDHLIFHSAGPDQQAFIEGYGRDVLPKLRAQSKGSSKTPPRKRTAAQSKGG